MMDDHGMHDAHQGMDHSAHGDYGAESAAQHHPGHDGSAMEHMGHMMHSMTVRSFKIYNNNSLHSYFNILCVCSSISVVMKRFYLINGKLHHLVKCLAR